jgi:epoxyqueuosine reductase
MINTAEDYSRLIKEEALRLGFDACGISNVHRLDEDADRLSLWLLRGMHGDMHYMKNHFDKRVDPSRLMPGSKSVISVLLNYFPSEIQHDKAAPVLSKYAFGKDYHKVIKNKLNKLLHYINKEISAITGRAFVDSAPVLDRAWAALSGLGWIGKNSMLISPKVGSFIFIGSLIIDLELSYDKPIHDHCGGCNKCIQACPTHAIQEPRVIDSNRCISYLTIENKKEIPSIFKGKFQNRVFGCDICQDVCPWNRKAKPHQTVEFNLTPILQNMTKEEWINLDEKQYSDIFQSSAVKRAKFEGLKRNIDFITD